MITKSFGFVLLGTIVSAILTVIPQEPAKAGLRICNRTSLEMDVAIGYFTQRGLWSEGWWTLAPNQCKVVRGGGKPRYSEHYIHAHSRNRELVVRGSNVLCTTSEPFKILNSGDEGLLPCSGKYEDFKSIRITTSKYTYSICPPGGC